MAGPLFTFWDGPLTWLERLCLASQVAQGHPVTLFAYDGTHDALTVPDVAVQDARDILPLTPEVRRILLSAPQIVADWFRYRGLAAGLGTWIDTDMLLMKPVPEMDRLYGFEHPTHRKINNAVLHLLADDPILKDLISFSQSRPVMAPWWRGKRAMKHAACKAIGRPIPPERCQWGVFGPKALTHFVHERGGWGEALDHTLFYPVPFERTDDLVTDDADVLDFLKPHTIGIHLWGSRVRKLLGRSPPPRRSVLGRALRYGLGPVP